MAALWDTLYDCGCRLVITPWPHLVHCHTHHPVRRIVMSTALAPGGTASFHATAYLDLADTEVDINATVSWKSDNEAVATVVDNGSAAGVGACTVTAVADGTANLISVATDADGKAVDSLPWPIAVAVPVPDAVAVVITQDPAPAPPAA
jgi:hypothetical protein